MKKTITLIILLLIPIVLGDTVTNCIDSNTMQRNVTKNIIIGNNETDIIISEYITCNYGCENNQCQNASLITNTSFLIFFGFSVVMFVMSSITENKLFSLIGGMVLLVLSVYMASEGIVVNDVLLKNLPIRIISAIFILFSIYLMLDFGAWIRGERNED